MGSVSNNWGNINSQGSSGANFGGNQTNNINGGDQRTPYERNPELYDGPPSYAEEPARSPESSKKVAEHPADQPNSKKRLYMFWTAVLFAVLAGFAAQHGFFRPQCLPGPIQKVVKKHQDFGLKILASGNETTALDVIAIHGLDGHRLESWTAPNHLLWLRDLLPEIVPQARIMTYGYDAYTRDRDQLNHLYLYDHAQNLVSALATERQKTSNVERPIVFVAHSLGGIVLKYALIHSSATHADHIPHHKAVERSTYGILFLGTPHQGSESASLAETLLRIQSIYKKTNDATLRDLTRDSKALQQQLSQYASISGNYDTKFLFESYSTCLPGGMSQILVPRSSAVVPGAVNAEAIALYKDHVSMAKFESAEDGDFETVSSLIGIMAKSAPVEINRKWNRYRAREDVKNGH